MSNHSVAQTSAPASEPADSEIIESGEFPRSVNWSNPRVRAILEAAAECFSKGGFTATTLADIGRELGLRKSIVHYYFTSKAALVHEVQSFSYGRYLEAIRSSFEARAEGSVGDALSALWGTLTQSSAIRGLNIELWSEGRRDPELRARAETLQDEARALIAQHLGSAGPFTAREADDLATVTLSLLDGLTVLAEREGSDERAHRAFAAFLKLLDRKQN